MKVLFWLFFISTTVHAYPNLKIENISGKFQDNKGSAFAELAQFDLQEAAIIQKDTELNFLRPNKNLVLSNENTTIKLKIDFSFMNLLEFFEFDSVMMNSDLKKFDITAPHLTVGVGAGKYTLKQIEIESDISKDTSSEQDIDILDGFLIRGELNIKSIFLGILNKSNIIDEMIAENPDQEIEIINKLSSKKNLPLTIRNLRLLVKTKTFSGSVFLDSWLNATVYFGGKIDYQKETRLLTVSLLKARLGYFSIRKLLLRTIARLGIKGVIVRGSDIIIDLGKTYQRD